MQLQLAVAAAMLITLSLLYSKRRIVSVPHQHQYLHSIAQPLYGLPALSTHIATVGYTSTTDKPPMSVCHPAPHTRSSWLPHHLRHQRTRRQPGITCSAAATQVVPQQLLSRLEAINHQWVENAVQQNHQLTLADGRCSVVLLGVCFFAPQQDQLVVQALQLLQPDHILIEQPPSTGSPELLLPYPAWLQAVVDCIEQFPAGATGPAQEQLLRELQGQLNACADMASASIARVGRDIIDPLESFGYYGGLDFVRQPGSITQVMQLAGFLPGLELAAAAQYALTQGALVAAT